MISPLVSAGIMLSYKCNSKCKHCLYCCSPEWSHWADSKLLHAIYSGTKKCAKEIYGFHIAGGEAFLNFPLLLESVQLAMEYEIPLDYVETNTGWFTDMDSAVGKLEQLRDAGLNCLLISASPYHAEYIPIEKTIGAIQASLSVFGRSGTMVWLPEFLQDMKSIAQSGKIALEDFLEKTGRTRETATYGGQLIPGGRSSYNLSRYMQTYPKEQFFGQNCHYELIKSARGHFDPYGNIITGVCSGISMGDAYDLENSYDNYRLEDHPVANCLATGGVEALYNLAASEYGYEDKGAYIAKCHLCMDIRRHLVSCNADFGELTPKEFYKRI